MFFVEDWGGGAHRPRQSLCVRITKITLGVLSVAASIGGIIYWTRGTADTPTLAGPSPSPLPPRWTDEALNIQVSGKIVFTNVLETDLPNLSMGVHEGVSNVLQISPENVIVSNAYLQETRRERFLQSNGEQTYLVDWSSELSKNQSITLASPDNPEIDMGALSVKITNLVSHPDFTVNMLTNIHSNLPPEVRERIPITNVKLKDPIQANGVLPSSSPTPSPSTSPSTSPTPSPSTLPSTSPTPTPTPSPSTSPSVSSSPSPSTELSQLIFLLI